jgi:tetratricopeptide (TPR) repeat protein
MGEGDPDAAIVSYQAALELAPHDAQAHFNLGMALFEMGRTEEAALHFARTVERRSRYPRGHFALAAALTRLGRDREALPHYQRAVVVAPDDAGAQFELALAYTRLQRPDPAIQHFERALELAPQLANARANLSIVLHAQRRYAEAIAVLRQGLAIDRDQPRLAEMLAWLLATTPDATLRKGNEAIQLADQLVLAGGERLPQALHTKAAALAELGRFDEAITTARRAIELAQQRNDAGLAQQIQANLRLFEAGAPVR